MEYDLDWEWRLVTEESSKSTAFPSVLPSSGVYGGRGVYDDEEPLTRFVFRAIGVPGSGLAAIRTAYRLKKTKYDLTDSLGEDHSGYVTGYRFENVKGSEHWNIDIEMTKVTTEL